MVRRCRSFPYPHLWLRQRLFLRNVLHPATRRLRRIAGLDIRRIFLAILTLFAIGPVTGTLADRLGPKGLVAGGTALVGCGLVAASFAQALCRYRPPSPSASAEASGWLTSPAVGAVQKWFDRRRGLASGRRRLRDRRGHPDCAAHCRPADIRTGVAPPPSWPSAHPSPSRAEPRTARSQPRRAFESERCRCARSPGPGTGCLRPLPAIPADVPRIPPGLPRHVHPHRPPRPLRRGSRNLPPSPPRPS